MSGGCPACGFQQQRRRDLLRGLRRPAGAHLHGLRRGAAPAGVAFCTACGAEQRRPDVGLERKIVSVVFVDVVGFTSMAERSTRRTCGDCSIPTTLRAREELERYGGTVEKFIGDAVMALFGAPVAHEDDAERAVRAALRRARGGARAAPDAGHAGAGGADRDRDRRGRGGRARPAGGGRGDGPRATWSTRPPGCSRERRSDGILVDERTYRGHPVPDRLPRGSRRCRRRARPSRCRSGRWSRRAGAPGSDRSAPRAPLIGRERETRGCWSTRSAGDACAGPPRMVTLVGPPGIGKSRLVWELYQRVEQGAELIFWRQGRSLPYGDGVSFWALAEIVKGARRRPGDRPAADGRGEAADRGRGRDRRRQRGALDRGPSGPAGRADAGRELRGDRAPRPSPPGAGSSRRSPTAAR